MSNSNVLTGVAVVTFRRLRWWTQFSFTPCSDWYCCCSK